MTGSIGVPTVAQCLGFTLLCLAPVALRAQQVTSGSPATTAQRKDTVPLLRPPADTAAQQELTMRVGSKLIGRIVRVDADSVQFRASYGVVTLGRSDIVAVRDLPLSAMHNGQYWFASPNPTRLLFGPTGRVLPKGKAYVSDHWLFLVSGAYGVTDRVMIGGGMSILPSDNFFKQNVYFVTPKVSVLQRERVNASVGAFIGTVPSENDGEFNTFGIGYGAATWGTPDASFSAGAGYGFVNGDVANKPALMLGTELRFARRASFVSENYILPEVDGALVSYGVRLMGENLSVDLAFLNLTSEGVFPGIPFLGFSFRF